MSKNSPIFHHHIKFNLYFNMEYCLKLEFITNGQIYESVIQKEIPRAKRFLWIATADIKDMYVSQGKSRVPFLKVLSDLIKKGVEIRLIHAKEPGPRFREDFDKLPALFSGLERMLCPGFTLNRW